MNEIKKVIQDFDNNIENAYSKISGVIKDISDKDEHIKEIIQNFRDDISAIKFDSKNMYDKELQTLIETYKSECNNWCNAIEEHIKGKVFIDQFEKSLLIVVFGNVNVGKSSVGNLIAGVIDPNNSNDYSKDMSLLEEFYGSAPDFYEYDIAGSTDSLGAKKQDTHYFKEGYIETTANIQYFTRNKGLTWTDSPGICSVNKENGNLAKKYVDFADLVIFITTSSSPAKNDEIEELKKLFGKKKNVLILNNKSDQIIKDEIDGKLVKTLAPKSDESRKKQEAYITKSFEDCAQDIISSIDAVSISTYLAMEGLRNNDFIKFEQSGFPLMYKKLGSIFSENAVDLKMEAPKNRINSIIDEIIEGGDMGSYRIKGINQYILDLSNQKTKIADVEKKIDLISKDAATQIMQSSLNDISNLVQENAHRVRKGENSEEINEKINEIITSKTKMIIQEELQAVISDYQNSMFNQIAYNKSDSVKVEAKIDTIERVRYDVKTVSRDPSGLIEHVEHFLFKKEFTEDVVKKRKITESFINGDNSQAVLQNILNQLNNTLQDYIEDFSENIKNNYFSEQCNIIDNMISKLNQIEAALKKESL